MSQAASFIGIDLAWSPKNSTGVAALVLDGDCLRVRATGVRGGDAEILQFVAEHLASTTIVMVDAPLVVKNESGMRDCDKLTHHHFGRFHAGAYPANRGNMGRYNGGVPRGEALGLLFQSKLGFAWPPPDVSEVGSKTGRYLFEVYPHPAQVVLFGLDHTLKYKRKRQGITIARSEFARYVGYVRKLRRPAIKLDRKLVADLDVAQATGRSYKEREDRLDALFCAYLAALVPAGRMDCIGVPREGSIVVPLARVDKR